MSLWPTLVFCKSLPFFKYKYCISPILHCPHRYLQFLPTIYTQNFYPQFCHRFPQIFTDLHSFIWPFSLYLSIFFTASRLQDLHRSSTDLPKIFHKFSFLHSLSLGDWTVGHSGPLSSFPSPSFSSLFTTDLHRSSTDLPKKIFFLHPPLLGIWTVGHSGPLSSSPSPPLF